MRKSETARITNYVAPLQGAKRTSYRRCIPAAALAGLFSVVAWSQTQLATVSGTITDPTGAVVPDVVVTIVSQGLRLESRLRYAERVRSGWQAAETVFACRVGWSAAFQSSAFQASVSQRYAHNFSWQASYTLAHSVDDASVDYGVESVNDPPASQNIFNRKGSRGPSDFDIRHNFVANVVYQLPGRGRLLGGWQVPAVASAHSGVPSSCWFNPGALAVPPAGEFGNAGRNILRGPGFAELDPALHKDFALTERRKITVGAEAYNLFNHPNFGVPINTQSAFLLAGSGDAIFKDAAGNFAANAGQILTTAGTARQIQMMGRFTF